MATINKDRTHHTPGPWHYEKQPDISDNEDGYTWAITASTREEREGGSRSWPSEKYIQNPAYANNEANARLIAAAPELLEALTDLIKASKIPNLGKLPDARLNAIIAVRLANEGTK